MNDYERLEQVFTIAKRMRDRVRGYQADGSLKTLPPIFDSADRADIGAIQDLLSMVGSEDLAIEAIRRRAFRIGLDQKWTESAAADIECTASDLSVWIGSRR